MLFLLSNLQEYSMAVFMNILIKYDISLTCKAILQEQLEKLAIDFNIIGLNEIEFKKDLLPEQTELLKSFLLKYGIEIIENQKTALVQKIKDTITDMGWREDILQTNDHQRKLYAYGNFLPAELQQRGAPFQPV